MTWLRSEPSNQTTPIHQHNYSQDKDSPSDPPGLLVEETLDFQEEYPQEVAEEAEEEAEEGGFTLQCPHNMQLLIQEISLSATRCSHSQEIARSLKRS